MAGREEPYQAITKSIGGATRRPSRAASHPSMTRKRRKAAAKAVTSFNIQKKLRPFRDLFATM
jgi:hypothetical protein